MPEKGLSSSPSPNHQSWLFRSSPLLQWRFHILTALVFVGMVTVWSIDGCTIKNVIESWRFRQEEYLRKVTSQPSNATNLTQSNTTDTTETSSSSYNILNNDNSSYVPASNYSDGFLEKPLEKESEEAHAKWVSADVQQNITSHQNLSAGFLEKPIENELEANVKWVSAILEPDLTPNLLSRWLAPGGEPCKDSRTVDIVIPGLDGRNLIELTAGNSHEFIFQAVDEFKNPLCLGGDYFETDLSGEEWKSRPLVRDFGNGSYSISLQVHPDFVGDYNLTVILLFRHFEGLKFSPSRFVYDRELRKVQIRFVKAHYKLPELQICQKSDFTKDLWLGRWTRHGKNDGCEISNDGRYRCLPSDFPCQSPWCNGSLGLLESNGWVYSSHCSFRLFSADSAWNCLKGRWIFFWGDSNHVDTIRNMLNFLLDLPDIKSVPRRFDRNFSNPKDASQSVRITSIFNGHWNETQNYLGLDSLKDEGFRNLLKKYFSEDTVPDTIILNSGLHDGIYWKNVRRFSAGADYAVSFWKEVVDSVKQRGLVAPKIFYRTTISTGGYARALAFNPYKMEVFNWVVLDKFRQSGLLSGVIDNFDMTFPWHYDNRCNDGVHYGRAPAKMKWRDGEIGHQYFVDLMLAHVLLNVLCL
ncbi:uncharacterized protein LOC8271560 [Ricinus communis]|uniref:Uncharacterized protein n=1 Tax=Ricinus communis TaxID=3988 RepID=B9RTT4_RICCO|nr:uncharacterized protein LOC8271560 [Ricinus communis]EEF45316.1 conserved hypothetical protein [Ricinus communis]|eukprot:XP_015573542.1 uncharacterized protein LOC8271560 [Ricinus communis]